MSAPRGALGGHQVELPPAEFSATLTVSDGPRAVIVLIVSGRLGSERDGECEAEILLRRGFATLLVRLLAPREAAEGGIGLDPQRLADRVLRATDWLGRIEETSGLPVGYLGTEASAVPTLVAAARASPVVRAVVSRGSSVEQVGPLLLVIRPATLLLVSGDDEMLIDSSRRALGMLPGPKNLAVVPGRLAEQERIEHETDAAARWIESYLGIGS